MFRPKNPTPPATHRFPRLQKVLGEDDLQFLLNEAGQRPGTLIELPFLSGPETYMLTVRLGADSYEPVWSYYQGDDAQARMLWRHPTGDVNLVLNLCATSSGSSSVGVTDYTAVAPQQLAHLGQNQNTRTTITGMSSVDLTQTLPNIPTVASGGAAAAPSPFAQTTTTSGKIASMQGDLSNMQIPSLLQSIQLSKMTGKLVVTNAGTSAAIFFEDGTPTHALTAESTGDPAIVEMITWEEGQFAFYPAEKTNERTVKRRIDGLLMEGVTMLDQNKYVREQGLKPQSYLVRKHDRISEEEFKAALTKGAPLDFEKQKHFYGLIDNASTLVDILRRMPMIRNEWVPLMFNMLTCGLVTVSDTPPAGVTIAPVVAVPHLEIDRAAIQGVQRGLTRQETGIYTYPALLFFLEQEFHKCAALGMPLSVLVLEPKLRVGESFQPLSMQFQRDLFRRIETIKRPFDVLGHFETFDYAMFLPATHGKAAKVFALHLIEILATDPPIPKLAGQLVLFTGIAAAPDDTQELGVLLSAAREAKNRARDGGQVVGVFKELTQR